MIRGGMGLNKVHMDRQMKENFAKMGQQIEKESLEKLKHQLEDFSKNLENFAIKHKDEIKYNPDFRQKFYMMCKEIGVDPIASTSLWNKKLNLAEFYYNLAVR
jgi:ESCRT-II complex subunit VPS22